ncbi:FAD-binding domain-containing protein [Zalerion maritima]|uniref:FAD-binding domain-containing protein n=1 Tax=Zalerion maritima TaxID=339359 RepID=A0AAD5RNT1_9PEZI|nr:FAD-binding domain-containing protein [Zalerion maritima]
MRVLTLLQVLPLSLALAGNSGPSGHHGPSCKASPDGDDWPSPSQWAALSKSVDGRLFVPTPPGAVCHPGERSYDPERCVVVQSEWIAWGFHEQDAVSTAINNFNNDTCLPEPDYPCSPGGYPRLVVNATQVEHVKRAVEFAKKHSLRLNIKATGHDFLGRSNAPNSLSIWTHHMKGMEFHDSFKPKGCRTSIDTTAISAEAGSQMYELYTALDARGQTLVGGGGKTVGIGGYVTGGGHSILSGKHGLAADNVLEVEMVTPEGKFLIANECQNEDLFWAVRGGGGSTFGVLTSITMHTFPTPTMPNLIFAAILPLGDPQLVDLWAYGLSHLPHLVSSGVYGYMYLLPAFPLPGSVGDETTDTVVSGFYFTGLMPGQPDVSTFDTVMAPLMAEMNTKFESLTLASYTVMYDNFLDWYNLNHDQSTTGEDMYLGSRLFDEKSLTADEDALREMLEKVVAPYPSGSLAHFIGGEGVWNAEPRGGSNAVLPAWRNIVSHQTVNAKFPPLNVTAEQEARRIIETRVSYLRELTPDTGSYVNEAYVYEPDFQHAFWGNNYDRLLAIKRRIDPLDVLWCHPCVGNERWEEVGGKLCKV